MTTTPKCRGCRHPEADHNNPVGNGLHCTGIREGWTCNCPMYIEPLPPGVTVRRRYEGRVRVTEITVRGSGRPRRRNTRR